MINVGDGLPNRKWGVPLYAGSSTYPASGQRVQTPDGPAKVVSRHPPGGTVVVRRLADGATRRCALADACGSRRAYEDAKKGPTP